MQKQQNLGKFPIFDVFVQLWIFTLTTNIENVNSNLSYATMYIIGKHFWEPPDHRWPQSLKLSFTNFVIFGKNFAKITQLQLRFFQRRKKIFDSSGRFSESSNDCYSVLVELQQFFSSLVAFRRKIALKECGSLRKCW
jgi:hypothetical protein